jgi:hypothetical protein
LSRSIGVPTGRRSSAPPAGFNGGLSIVERGSSSRLRGAVSRQTQSPWRSN